MRNGFLFLSLLATAVLTFFVALPLLGFLLVVLIGGLILLVGLTLAAPLLAKLPWFRERIVVEKHGGRRFVRFGRGMHSPFGDRSDAGYQTPGGRRDNADVIEVEGREISDKD